MNVSMKPSLFIGSNKKAVIWLSLFSTALFINAIRNDFTYDDIQIIKNNHLVWGNLSLNDLFSQSRAIRLLSLKADYLLFTLAPQGYHVQNIIWHCCCTILVYFLCLRLGGEKALSMIVALLFASHPANVEAVANISNRKDMLCMAFSITAFLAYLKSYEYIGIRRLVVLSFSVIAWIIAILSKQTAAVVPFGILIYEYIFIHAGKKRLLAGNVFIIGPILLPFSMYYAFSYIKPVLIEFYLYSTISICEYIFTTLRMTLFYCSMLLWPTNMSADHVITASKTIWEVRILLSIFISILLVWGIIGLRKKHPVAAFGILWSIIFLLPVTIIPGTSYFAAERYLYIPSFGYALVLGSIILSLLRHRAAFVIISLIILFNSLNTINRNTIWYNSATLWMDTFKKDPDSALAHNNLGLVYLSIAQSINKEEYKNAIKHFEAALLINPLYPNAHNNLGLVYANQGRLDEASKEFKEAIKLCKVSYECSDYHYNLGVLLSGQNRDNEAIEEYKAALKINPKYIEAAYNLGLIYLKKGLDNEARAAFNSILKLQSNNAQARYALELLEKDIAESRMRSLN